jgi:TRAP-type C4-dicarboxylate transport system permease small subunit
MRALRRLVSYLVKWLLVFMLLLMTLVLFAQIVFRYFFQMPLVWSEEMALVLMLWITFLGAALLLESKEHISIDFLVERMSPSLQRALAVVAALLMLVFNIALTYGAFLVVEATASSITPGMKISVAWHYGGAMVGGFLLALVSLEHLAESLGLSSAREQASW